MKTIGIVLSVLVLFNVSCSNKETPANNNTKASFSVSGYEVPVPCAITFINNSSNASSYLWDFGDGSTSTQTNPVHTYNFNGTFILKLKATGSNGSDSVCKLLTVDLPPAVNKTGFSYYQEKCSGTPVGVSFKSLNPSSTSPVWDMGNGSVALQKEVITQYLLPGDYTVKFSTLLAGVRDTLVRIIRIQ